MYGIDAEISVFGKIINIHLRPCASAWLDTSIVRAVQPISSPRARLEYTSSGEGVVLSISTNSSSIKKMAGSFWLLLYQLFIMSL